VYTQFIQQGESYLFSEFVQEYDLSCFVWESLLNTYLDSFGKEKIIVKRYEKKYLQEQNSLLKSFADTIIPHIFREVNL